MDSNGQVSRLLDDEHRALLELLGRLENAIVHREQHTLASLARALLPQLEQGCARHFDFEENELFPLLADAGDGPIAALLTEEHESIRTVAAELLPLARGAAEGNFQNPEAFRRLGLEFIERQVAHIQKETMALLPLLDDLLDDETDRRLAFEHAGG